MGADSILDGFDRKCPSRSKEEQNREAVRLQPVQRKTENESTSQYPAGHLVQIGIRYAERCFFPRFLAAAISALISSIVSLDVPFS